MRASIKNLLEALRSMHARPIAALWTGTLLLTSFSVLWLQIPDSHAWQFAFSILSAAVLLAFFFGLYTWVFRTMLQPNATFLTPWWLRWLLLAAVMLAWWLLQSPIDKLVEHENLYAGYWTSQLPTRLRGLHTFEHLVLVQDWVYFSLRLIVTALLLPIAVLVSTHGLKQLTDAFRVWTKWWYWLIALVCGWLAFAISDRMMNWTAGTGLRSEMLSLLVRLGLVYTLDVLLASFVLALIAVALRRNNPLAETTAAN